MFCKDKNILVTGAAGFVATNLIKRLLELEANVTGTLYKRSPQFDFDYSNLSYYWGDLTNKEFCSKICKNKDIIFMCAANSHGAAYIENNPLSLVTSNVIMNSLMLEAAYENNIEKVVFISSSVVYPDISHPMSENEITRGPIFEKYFGVGWMKRFGEILCEMYSCKIKNPMTTIIIRPGNLYGPYDDFNEETSHVIPALIKKIVEKQSPIEIWGDGKDIRDFIYIDDFINGLLLSSSKIDSFNIFNMGSGRIETVNDVLNVGLEIENYENAKIIFNMDKPTMIAKRMLDNNKAERLLGFKALTELKEGIEKTIKWYKKNKT